MLVEEIASLLHFVYGRTWRLKPAQEAITEPLGDALAFIVFWFNL